MRDLELHRYDPAPLVRLPLLLPGAVTAWHGKRAVVVTTREWDDGSWRVHLDDGTRRGQHLSGPAEALLPVLTDPYPVCSCHGDPWPCDVAWDAQVARLTARAAEFEAMQRCHGCGQEHNLGPHRFASGERRRYCRRKACAAAGDRWQEDARARATAAWRERQAFAETMTEAFGTVERVIKWE